MELSTQKDLRMRFCGRNILVANRKERNTVCCVKSAHSVCIAPLDVVTNTESKHTSTLKFRLDIELFSSIIDRNQFRVVISEL